MIEHAGTRRPHTPTRRIVSRRAYRAASLLALSLAAAGCGGRATDPGPLSLDVEASRVAGGVQIANATSQPIAYAVWNRGWLALFAPCTDTGPECPRLAPGETLTVQESDIDGWAPGATEAIVRWWTVVPDGAGGVRAGAVHEIIIPL
jgi:hypothetical protein